MGGEKGSSDYGLHVSPLSTYCSRWTRAVFGISFTTTIYRRRSSTKFSVPLLPASAECAQLLSSDASSALNLVNPLGVAPCVPGGASG